MFPCPCSIAFSLLSGSRGSISPSSPCFSLLWGRGAQPAPAGFGVDWAAAQAAVQCNGVPPSRPLPRQRFVLCFGPTLPLGFPRGPDGLLGSPEDKAAEKAVAKSPEWSAGRRARALLFLTPGLVVLCSDETGRDSAGRLLRGPLLLGPVEPHAGPSAPLTHLLFNTNPV